MMREGDVILERFLLQMRAGSGGMGTVFRALDMRTGTSVAVKTCGQGAFESKTRARFEIEAESLSELRHPGIVEYVFHGTTSSEEPFLVMRWIAGLSLAERLAGEGVTLQGSLELGGGLVEALAALHARGIVHRDLKPRNVMLPAGDVRRPVLVDFGIVRRVDDGGPTASGSRLGTPRYMAPEQIRDPSSVDGRADVFSLGCVLYESLTGVPAFPADDALGTVAQILLEGARDPREVRPELPADVANLVLSLLAQDREARPPADEALREQLRALVKTHRAKSLPPPTRSGLMPAVSTVSSQGTPSAARPASSAKPARAKGFELTSMRAPPLAHFPRFAGAYLGREAELDQLSGILGSGSCLVNVCGPAGVGKTRILVELATRFSAGGAFEVRFADLRSAKNSDDVVRATAHAVGAVVHRGETDQRAIVRALERLSPALVALDSVDVVADAVIELLTFWQRNVTSVRFFAISRERLRRSAALAIELGPLSVSSASGELSMAARLMLARIHEGGESLELDAATRRALENTVRRLDGIPLAIELAAARVPVLGLKAVAKRALDPLTLIGNARGPLASHQKTMREAISESWSVLDPSERAALKGCAVFSGSFEVPAAEAVVHCLAPDLDVLDALQRLRDRCLLGSYSSLGAGPGERRLSLLSPVREFALEQLREHGQEQKARAEHARFFAKLVDFDPTGADDVRTSGSVRRLEADIDNLIAATDYALDATPPLLAQAVGAVMVLEPVWRRRGPFPAFLSILDRVVSEVRKSTEPLPPSLVSRLERVRGSLLATSGRSQEAIESLNRALRAAEALGDDHLRARAALELGVVHHLLRKLDDARFWYEQAASLLEKLDDVRLRGRCRGNLGAIHHDRRRFGEARACYLEAIALLEGGGEQLELANFITNLAVLEHEAGELDSARAHFTRALQLLEALGNERVLAIAIGNYGVLEQECGNWELAVEQHRVAIELLEPTGDSTSLALALGRLGGALAVLRRASEAEAELSRAQRIAGHCPPVVAETVRLQRAFIELGLAESALDDDKPSEASEFIESARSRIARVSDAGAKDAWSAHSDDIRALLRILRPKLLKLEAALEASCAN